MAHDLGAEMACVITIVIMIKSTFMFIVHHGRDAFSRWPCADLRILLGWYFRMYLFWTRDVISVRNYPGL